MHDMAHSLVHAIRFLDRVFFKGWYRPFNTTPSAARDTSLATAKQFMRVILSVFSRPIVPTVFYMAQNLHFSTANRVVMVALPSCTSEGGESGNLCGYRPSIRIVPRPVPTRLEKILRSITKACECRCRVRRVVKKLMAEIEQMDNIHTRMICFT